MTFFALSEGFVSGLLAVKDRDNNHRIAGCDPYHVVSEDQVDHSEVLLIKLLFVICSSEEICWQSCCSLIFVLCVRERLKVVGVIF